VKAALKRPLIVDLRNIYRPAQMAEAGFEYVSVGRPSHRPGA
jgi:UDPglucose 6-dehydrogenase